MKTPAPMGPHLDVSVEADAFMRTFKEYERLTSLTPAQAVEKQAVGLRVDLVKAFLTVKMRKGQARAEMAGRGGRLKVRKSIRDKYKDTDAFLVGKHGKAGLLNQESKGTVMKGKIIQRGARKGERRLKAVPAWKEAVKQELAARNRSRSFLAASWLNPFQAVKDSAGKTGMFVSKVKSGTTTGQVIVRTAGPEPEVILRNFVEGVAKVGFSRGIIARAMRESTDDMRAYIVRKLQKNAQALATS